MIEPLRKQVHVACDIDHAFDVFTGRADLWWPPSHRQFEGSTIVIEPHVGGRFLERSATGEEWVIGEVLRYDRPTGLEMTWVPGKLPAPSHVSVNLSPADGGTRVEIVHRAGAAGEAWSTRIALFDQGWSRVLRAYADIANQ